MNALELQAMGEPPTSDCSLNERLQHIGQQLEESGREIAGPHHLVPVRNVALGLPQCKMNVFL